MCIMVPEFGHFAALSLVICFASLVILQSAIRLPCLAAGMRITQNFLS